MKKGQVCEGIIERVDFPDKGIIHAGDDTVIVRNGVPGQKVRFTVNKKRKDHCEGRITEVLESSPCETNTKICGNFPECGGCMYQTMSYDAQLQMKSDQVKRLLDKAVASAGVTDGSGSADYIFEGIEGSPSQWEYRNKMEFSFGDMQSGGPLTLGLHRKGSYYDVMTADDCRIVHGDFRMVLRCVLDYFTEFPMPYYRKKDHTGYLRHLLLRRSVKSGDILVCLVTTGQAECNLAPFTEALQKLPLTGEIAGILHIINDSPADVVQSDETRILYGRDWFYEYVLGLKFKVTPFSFFQTNTCGAEVLYDTVRNYIGDTVDKTVFDLYSGTGTIAQLAASAARKVIGVEIVPEAVEAARENAVLNGLDNCTFIEGDVLKVIDSIEERPDCIVLDPPRDGIHPKALPKIIACQVPEIIYISCKPTSLARDIPAFIAGGYRAEKVKCVDMFPNTVHVETVVLFRLYE